MFLRPLTRLYHSLAFRLTLWYALIFTISSCAAFLFFYMLITAVIQDRTDKDLLEQAGKFSTLLNTDGINAVKRVAILEAQAAGERKIFFRLLSLNGETFSSSNMSYWRDIDVDRIAISDLIKGARQIFDTVVIPGRKHNVRILYAVVGPRIILQLGQSMENTTRFIDAFKTIFITTMVLLVVLAALIGWFMAKKALSGLEEVTQTAQRISKGELEERVPINKREDEIDQLAITFNQMLDRIENLVIGVKEMSDNIAHDLKSPITRIRGGAEVTLTTAASMDEYRSMAASTIEDCDRLLDMIDTMLLISKTEAGVGKMKTETMDLEKIVRDACELFGPLAEDKRVSLTCHVSGELHIIGDTQLIQRMIANLLDNAIKYTQIGGSVHVTVNRADRGALSIAITDTGPGITENDLPHIFERFYRGDPSRAQTGSGLGLSLAQAISKAHGGSIHVTTHPNRGSRFTITLPASPSIPG